MASSFIDEILDGDEYEKVLFEFIDSEAFNRLQVIMKHKYFEQLSIMHTKLDPTELLVQKQYMDIWLNLCGNLRDDADQILNNKKQAAEEAQMEL